MSKNNNIITINGREYDVFSGVPLDGSAPHQTKAKTTHKKSSATKSEAATAPNKSPKSPAAKAPVVAAKAPTPKKPRSKAKNVNPHPPKSATTLMRKAVKKPIPNKKRSIKANGIIQVQKKHSSGSISAKLVSRAKSVRRSPLIKHFNNTPANVSTKPSLAEPAPAKTQSKPKAITKKPRTTAELLDYAIAQSTSHEQAPPPKKSRNPLKRKS